MCFTKIASGNPKVNNLEMFNNMFNCNTECKPLDIENNDLASELVTGLNKHLRNEKYYKAEVQLQEFRENLKTDEVYKGLTDLIDAIHDLKRNSKKLKWWQIDNTESKIDYLENEIFTLYKKGTGERLWWSDVLDARDCYVSTMSRKLDTKLRSVADTSTIKAILLQTPKLKTKSFKELLAIVNEQTGISTSC